MQRRVRGRLLDSSLAPTKGETVERLASLGGVVVEQILSGDLEESVSYNQQHDEWVVLLEGAAELEVNGERVALTAGDWLLLPRQTPHRLLSTDPGSSWLAIHFFNG